MDEIKQFTSKIILENLEMTLFLCIFTFMWLIYMLDTYLDFRQQRILNKCDKPTKEVSLIMNEENYTKARLYSLDSKKFEFYHKLVAMIESSIILCCNVLPWSWKASISLIGESENIMFRELNGSVVLLFFIAIYSFVSGLPWKVYKTFIIEAKHGFNKQTPLFFVKDQIKSLVVSIVLMLPISYGLLLIIKIGGPYFYVYAWAFAFVVTMFMTFIYPEFIAPIFDKYTPLPDGELKSGIECLAAKIEFPLKKLYVVEGSKRSTHSNAYFYGFWKNKRIVLFDTLIKGYISKTTPNEKLDTDDKKPNEDKGCTNDEVIAILGHELGHWKLNHVLQSLLISQINLFLMLFMFGLLFNLNVLFRAFGFIDIETPTLIRLLLIVAYLFSPYHFVLGFFMTLLSRRLEFQADEFSVKLGHGDKLISALIKLNNDNLSFPIFDNLYSIFNHSHPPILERIEAIEKDENVKKNI